jgi:formylglycine-generating enzyme required for sulfatase activity
LVDVFISYPRAARAKVEPIKAKLDALGLDCFFDLENIDGGKNFPDIIDRALRTSKSVLCCWSPLYFERPWCMIECRDGLSRDIMVPVAVERFDKFAPPADLRQVNWFSLLDWGGEDAHEDWNRTLLSLGKLVGRELAPPLKKSLLGGVKVEGPAPVAPEAVQARTDLLSDLRATWANFPVKQNADAVERFLGRVRDVAKGSGLEFEVEHHLDELHRQERSAKEEAARVETERRAREAAEAEARRKAEHEERAKEERYRANPRLRPGAVWRDAIPGLPESACPEMVTIPPGKFMMGAPAGEQGSRDAERPQHEVRIDYAFGLGKHAVTFAQWDAAIAAGARLEKPNDQGWGRDRRPVINVSWEDAQAYVAWLNERLRSGAFPPPFTGEVASGEAARRRGDAPIPSLRSGLPPHAGEETGPYRLPSEAEWEYACRAGTTTPFSFGAMISTAQVNYDGSYSYGVGQKGEYWQKTTPVGSFPANAFGLHDMHGNVWEWCEDAWHDNYGVAPADGSAWVVGGKSSRVLRGGSWEDSSNVLRSALRVWFLPTFRDHCVGFRLARTV